MPSIRIAVLALLSLAPAAARGDTPASDHRVYAQPFDEIWTAAQLSCETAGWRTREVNPDAGTIVARSKLSLTTWGGVVSVNVAETPEGVAVAVSAGTSEWFDKRKNQRDLERFFRELDAHVSDG
jgi:hypothetical protein